MTIRALAVGLGLLLAPPALAADPPPPNWHGIWRGTIGSAPVMVCLDSSRQYQRGSYYYLRRLVPIRLDWDASKARWNEMSAQDKVQATLHFDKIAGPRIEGRWTSGGKAFALSFDRIEAKPDADFGLCGNMEFVSPRLGATRVVEARATKDGTAYRKLALVPPANFPSVTIETFALAGRTPVIERINRALAQPLVAEESDDGWISCMRGNLAAHGVDGEYYESLEPGMIGPRFVAVIHQSGGYCGGAHPYSSTSNRTFDLAKGAEIDLNDWLKPRAITGKRYADTSDEAKMVTPAFRDFILAGWKYSDMECREPVQRAEFWNIGLTRSGLSFSPSLAHVEQACGDDIAIPFARLAPWLSADGKAAAATISKR